MKLYGFAGSILYIDLTRKEIKKKPLDKDTAVAFMGGAGICSLLAYRIIDPAVHPLSPENAVIIGAGPLSGTICPGSSELVITYKSPLNNSFTFNCGGGKFGVFLKSCGYDHVVIQGKSKEPVCIVITDNDVQLIEAEDLRGKDAYTTTDVLRNRYEPCSIIPIGQAGENLVNISVAHIDKGGTVGSGGLAAVMGSKNLKAVVTTLGSRGIEAADPKRLKKAVDTMLDKVNAYHRRPDLLSGGMMAMTADWVPEHALAKNSTALMPWPDDVKDVQSDIFELHKKHRKNIACISCPMSDKDRIDLPERDTIIYDTAISSERGIMTTSPAFGHIQNAVPLDRYVESLHFFDLMNRFGIDRVYGLRGIADYAVTLYEKGLITQEDVGIPLDRKMETLVKLVEMIAFRQGIGDILADGVIETAGKIGTKTNEMPNNVVKGQFVLMDPRLNGLGPMEFAQLTFPGRCFGIAGVMGAPAYSPGWPIPKIMSEAKRCGTPDDALKRIFTDDTFNPARYAKHGEDFYNLFNILGLCHRLYISRFYSLEMIGEYYSAVTGVETTSEDLKTVSERVWNLWKILNCRVGYDRKDDEPPEIWFQPLTSEKKTYYLKDYYQKVELDKKDVDRLLDDYYDERGWDKEKGIPTAEKLSSLGLDDFSTDLT